MGKYFGRIVLLLCIICAVGQVKAQEKVLKGLIVIDFRDVYPEGILITNRSTKISVTSDMTGSFKINANVGDTLLLQGGFLEERKFVVRKSSFAYNPLVIHMNQQIISLKELIVRAPLTGDLEKDINSVKIREDVEQVYRNLGIDIRVLDMEPKERREHVLPKLGPIPIPTSLNIEALYKSISGYYRRMENLNLFERLEERLNGVKDHMGITYFEETLGIPAPEIRGFLLYVYDHSDGMYEAYYLKKNYLGMDRLLRSKAGIFKKRLEERDAVSK